MSQGNGKTNVEISDLATEELLKVILEALTDLAADFELFKEDVLEKLENLNLDNSGFGLDE